MERKIILTRDGSHSIYVPSMDVSFHSIHGAIQESMHVFIDSGLRPLLAKKKSIRIFEMGLGTGLNVLLTILEVEKTNCNVYYQSVDAFPLEQSFVEQINYCELLNRPDMQPIFKKIHAGGWEQDLEIFPGFFLHKINVDLADYSSNEKFDIIYFDAFDPESQPALWTLSIFKKLSQMLFPGGGLLTYCSKGSVRRAMQEAGFIVEKLAGPLYKREIVRATV